MTKHTTRPLPIRKIHASNSHAAMYSNQTMGNWNRHKKRRVTSSKRTAGRIRRSCMRAFERLSKWSADAAGAAL